jgi:hypothetical protein
MKILKNKRAITPVVSNLLLMIIAVAAMSIAATATYVITGNLRDTMGERFIVEDVWFVGGNGIAIYLRNVGRKAIRISAVYVNFTSRSVTPHPFELDFGEDGWLNVTHSWSSQSVYHVKIVTKRGTKLADCYKAP